MVKRALAGAFVSAAVTVVIVSLTFGGPPTWGLLPFAVVFLAGGALASVLTALWAGSMERKLLLSTLIGSVAMFVGCGASLRIVGGEADAPTVGLLALLSALAAGAAATCGIVVGPPNDPPA